MLVGPNNPSFYSDVDGSANMLNVGLIVLGQEFSQRILLREQHDLVWDSFAKI
jgi:hypothetical protein